MKIEVITHPSGDQLPILLDDHGLPLPTPNEFIMGRRSLSTNTLIRNLRELSVLYSWLEHEKIDLWKRIKTGQSFSEAEIRGSMIEALRRDQATDRKITRITISPHTFNQRLTTVRQFLSWCFDMRLSSLPLSDQSYDRIREQQKRLLKWLDTAFISAPLSNKGKNKGLNEKEISFLVNCLNPDNPEAIGRNSAVRFRNYISIMIMLYYGLRPGELLSLRVQDIEIGAISNIRVTRRPPDRHDARKPRPQIKRNGRVMPIDDPVFAQRLDEYIMNWRDILESDAKNPSEYLILSDEGNPLTQSALTQFFPGLRKRFPKQLPSHLSAKALRHTFSSLMEKTLRNAGLNEDRRKQALAILRGDSSLESQSVYIAQEIEEQASKALKHFQKMLLT
ncbi:MAG: integrase [Gammaproteobacteria bacterium RIFCSPHIGHO2_12_FULL_38_14]|nr:MAG: integrase [Gammaproteobacteria bacterium RIFCSPHIGHO2_12_FULL_38_14]